MPFYRRCKLFFSIQLSNSRLEKMNIKEYSQAVMIGDREHDIIGAKEHGLSCIGVLYGYGSREEFERYGADCIVETVSELMEEL